MAKNLKKLALVKDAPKFWTVYKPLLERYGVEVTLIDIFSKEDRDHLLGGKWDGFIFRAIHDPWIRNLGKRFLYMFEQSLGVKTFPTYKEYWLYDDKIAQSFLFQKLKIPSPKTFIYLDKKEALNFISNNKKFPLVYKASSGAGSSNVGLLKSKSDAKKYVKKAFGKGIKTYFKEDRQYHYVYFQEYLKNNDGDYRVICLGNKRIFGFYRMNNVKNKFASGSGILKYSEIPNKVLELVHNIHQKIGNPSYMTYDIMKDNSNNWVVTEISVIGGDLNSMEIYKNSNHYKVIDGKFIRIEESYNVLEYLITNLLKEWGWID